MAPHDSAGGQRGASSDYIAGADPATSVRAAAQRLAMLLVIDRLRSGQALPRFAADGTFFAYRGPAMPQQRNRAKVDLDAETIPLATPGLARCLPAAFRGSAHESQSTKIDRVLLDPIDGEFLTMRARIDRLGAAATGVIDDGALHRWILINLLGFDAAPWPGYKLPRLLIELFNILPRRTTAGTIERLVGRLLDVPVVVRQNVAWTGARFPGPHRVGDDGARLGRWCLGSRRRERERMFEVRIGPVAGKTAREFLPLDVHATAKHRLQLESLISFCQPANSDWRVAVTVRSDEAQMELGAKTPTAVLGLTSQLGRQHSDVDVEAMFAA